MSLALALSATRCVSDFVDVPKPPPVSNIPAASLAFTNQPRDAVAGTSISDSLTVEVRDSTGKLVTSGGYTVTLALTGGKPGAGLRGSRQVTSVGGVATFRGLSVDSASSGYVLQASSGSLDGASSDGFDVAAGEATRIGFITQPTNVVAFATITPAVRVALQDSLGNATGDGSHAVLITLDPTSQFGPRLLGDEQKNTNNQGIATFNDLRVSRTGIFVLRATTSGFSEVVSAPFTVGEPEDVTALSFTTQPANAMAGVAIAPSVRVAAINALGNTVTSASVSVTVALSANTTGASLGGTTTAATSGGVATFANLSVDKVGTAYALVATATGLTAATSTAFDIQAGGSARLSFVVSPSSGTAGTALSPPPRVAVLDAQGNLVTGATTAVALYVTAGTGASGATLSGTTTVVPSGGFAEFPGVSIAAAGSGYSLTATATGLASAVSGSFDLAAAGPPPAASVIVTPGSASMASLGVTQAFSAEARDAAGQPIGGAPVSWTSSNTSVATVSASGVVTTTGNGAATITATSGSASGTATVSVQQVTTAIVITSSNDSLKAFGASRRIDAEARDANNRAIAGRGISWTSETPGVATIDAAGNATAISNGTAVIRASADGFTTTISQVVHQAVAVVTVTPDEVTLALSESRVAQAAAVDSRGNAIARPFTTSWTSGHASATATPDATDSSKATITRVSTTGPNTIDVVVTVEGRSATVKVK